MSDADTTDWKAEAERLRAALDQSQQQTQEALDSWAATLADRRAEQYLAERNAAQREAGETVRKLRAERDEARAELAQAREVLIRMEWDSWGYDPYGEGRAHCPCCGCTKDEGHAPDCGLSAALAAIGAEGGAA